MIFEFLIAYHRAEDIEIVGVVRDCLAKVLEDNLNQFDDETVERMVIPRLERQGDYKVDKNDGNFCRALFGFALDLPEETASMRTVADEFVEALNVAPIIHLVKFDDPLIRADFARWADEIYALEMKLRRVLTLVYLHAYQDGDPYELLREEVAQPMNKEQSKPDYMKMQAENEFFYLTFGQYVGLNSRPEFKLAQLLALIRSKEEYDHLRQEVTRAPVEDEDDAVLLAGLKERMDAIEAMRNCCAHSRRPSKKVIQNYDNASPLLHQLLDDYLARWEWQEPVEEEIWDEAAREAVEDAMERARWDEDEKTITLSDRDEDRMRETVSSREELNRYLAQVANFAFYANAPRVDGEFLYECDEYDVLETVLRDYEERLEEFFGSDV